MAGERFASSFLYCHLDIIVYFRNFHFYYYMYKSLLPHSLPTSHTGVCVFLFSFLCNFSCAHITHMYTVFIVVFLLFGFGFQTDPCACIVLFQSLIGAVLLLSVVMLSGKIMSSCMRTCLSLEVMCPPSERQVKLRMRNKVWYLCSFTCNWELHGEALSVPCRGKVTKRFKNGRWTR